MSSSIAARAFFAALSLFSLPATVAAAPASLATIGGTASETGIAWVSDGSHPQPVEVEMRNVNRSFAPDLVIVPVGSSVRFPNDDPFFHSIYSSSEPGAFDVGFYATGGGKSVTFTRPAILHVGCHIHAMMHAIIAVVDGPSARVEAGKPFTLARVRPGRWTVHTWSSRGGEHDSVVVVPTSGTVALERGG